MVVVSLDMPNDKGWCNWVAGEKIEWQEKINGWREKRLGAKRKDLGGKLISLFKKSLFKNILSLYSTANRNHLGLALV